jgi:hypothetical protein
MAKAKLAGKRIGGRAGPIKSPVAYKEKHESDKLPKVSPAKEFSEKFL